MMWRSMSFGDGPSLRRKRSMSDGEGLMLGAKADAEQKKTSSFQYFGWVYHLGINKIGHEYCHLRFLFIKGKYVEMYKRDPHENPGIKPIRSGVVGQTLMVEDAGCRRVNRGDLYVLRFFNRLDESKKGEIACATAEEAKRWLEAFDQAKQQAELELLRGGSARDKLNMEAEIDLDAHRRRVRRYAHGLIKLIKIGQGPEPLLRQSSTLSDNVKTDGYLGADGDADAIEAHTWRCVCTLNGIRIFEDVGDPKGGKNVLVKSVGIIDAAADTVFDVLLSLEPSKRFEWDMLTSELELVESIEGNYDVVYGVYGPKYFTGWNSKRDFVFSRQWFRGQDGTYTILQLPAVHKKRPPKSGYQRKKTMASTWEIKNLDTTGTESPRCVVTHMLEVESDDWSTWKKNRNSKFEKSIPFALLCQVAGVKEYIGANLAFVQESSAIFLDSRSCCDDAATDHFYDAISTDSSADDDSDNDVGGDKDGHMKVKNVQWAIASLSVDGTPAPDEDKELGSAASSVTLDPSQFLGSMRQGKDDDDADCWTNPGGTGFMIRGKTYLKDNAKELHPHIVIVSYPRVIGSHYLSILGSTKTKLFVIVRFIIHSSRVRGGDPLLKLVAVDWLKAEQKRDKVALRPSCIVQSEAGKKLPFILVVNLQIPSKPNYNMVFYYAADRSVSPDSLLGKFIDGTDTFRDSRFKLIPSIVKGYWMVKRAVGTKACLLGKAVTCKYLRQDNFLEIDVDIGSSSVARNVIGLVLGYVTSLVVDLALLIEAKEEEELPEYLLGTVRLSFVKLESAIDA